MLEVELFGEQQLPEGGPSARELTALCSAAAASTGVEDGHLALELVDAERISQLNAQYRGKAGPTDVLSFPIDGAEPIDGAGPRELGDVVICLEHTEDLREAVVHGVLHLVGMDHETDAGEMLALQAQLLHGDLFDDSAGPRP